MGALSGLLAERAGHQGIETLGTCQPAPGGRGRGGARRWGRCRRPPASTGGAVVLDPVWDDKWEDGSLGARRRYREEDVRGEAREGGETGLHWRLASEVGEVSGKQGDVEVQRSKEWCRVGGLFAIRLNGKEDR